MLALSKSADLPRARLLPVNLERRRAVISN